MVFSVLKLFFITHNNNNNITHYLKLRLDVFYIKMNIHSSLVELSNSFNII